MGRRFEQRREAELPARPEQVWDAIATGPGIDSWFMGRSEVEGGLGGVVRTALGPYRPEAPISAWAPGEHLAYGTEPAPDGRFIAYEFLIEGRDSGTTVLRAVTSGFLPGDDWADEFEAMGKGGDLYFATLSEYVVHFAGRSPTVVSLFDAGELDPERSWRRTRHRLGEASAGSVLHLEPAGGRPIEGRVYFASDHAVALRTDDALLRFIRGFGKPTMLAHQVFAESDADELARLWTAWLNG